MTLVPIWVGSAKHVWWFSGYLRYPHGAAQPRLDLPQVHHASHAHHLQHAVPVVGLVELVVLLRAPRVGARAPADEQKQLYVC